MENISILYCSNAYPPKFIGGAELIAHYQAKHFKSLGNKVSVFAGDGSGARARYKLQKDRYDDLDVFRIALTHEDFDARFVNFFHPAVEEQFRTVLDAVQPDVVHMHNLVGLSAGLISLTQQFGAASILTVHDHWGFCYRNTLIRNDNSICNDFRDCAACMEYIDDGREARIPIRLRNDYLIRQFDKLDFLVSPSSYLAEAYIRAGVPESKVRVIWYGFDTARYSRVQRLQQEDKIRFTFLGYLGRHKGLHTLVEALGLIQDRSQISLSIVGEGELDGFLRSEVQKHHLQSTVNFLGKVDNAQIERVLEKTDVIVLPSIWPENQPVSIMEAMCIGIPVIASRMGGIPEMVEDGKSGYLFEAGNPRDLASKIQAFVDSPQLIPLFGKRARALIGDRTLETQVSRLAHLYTEAINLRSC